MLTDATFLLYIFTYLFLSCVKVYSIKCLISIQANTFITILVYVKILGVWVNNVLIFLSKLISF